MLVQDGALPPLPVHPLRPVHQNRTSHSQQSPLVQKLQDTLNYVRDSSHLRSFEGPLPAVQFSSDRSSEIVRVAKDAAAILEHVQRPAKDACRPLADSRHQQIRLLLLRYDKNHKKQQQGTASGLPIECDWRLLRHKPPAGRLASAGPGFRVQENPA